MKLIRSIVSIALAAFGLTAVALAQTSVSSSSKNTASSSNNITTAGVGQGDLDQIAWVDTKDITAMPALMLKDLKNTDVTVIAYNDSGQLAAFLKDSNYKIAEPAVAEAFKNKHSADIEQRINALQEAFKKDLHGAIQFTILEHRQLEAVKTVVTGEAIDRLKAVEKSPAAVAQNGG